MLVEEAIARAEDEGSTAFPGAVAFELHDTYGFPFDVTREIVEERGMTLDEERFETSMEDQRKRAREAQKGGECLQDAIVRFARADGPRRPSSRATSATISTRWSRTWRPSTTAAMLLALRESPFYAEMGGQTADTGRRRVRSRQGRGRGRAAAGRGPGHRRPAS